MLIPFASEVDSSMSITMERDHVYGSRSAVVLRSVRGGHLGHTVDSVLGATAMAREVWKKCTCGAWVLARYWMTIWFVYFG